MSSGATPPSLRSDERIEHRPDPRGHDGAEGGPDQALLIPVVVGVTGHRNLRADEEPRLRLAVGEAFAQLGRLAGDAPITILSALAEGADRLAAEVGLELGHRLVVPLPMPVGLYRTDFRDPASRAAFDRLLGRASSVHTLPPSGGAATWDEVDAGQLDEEGRRRQYEVLSSQLVRHSHALIALWDGRPGQRGGTADVVWAMRTGDDASLPTPTRIFGRIDGAAVLHVLTPRAGQAGVPDAGTVRLLGPLDPTPREAISASANRAAAVARTRELVEPVRTFDRRLSRLLSREQKAAPQEPRPDGAAGAAVGLSQRRFALADQLAIDAQRSSRRLAFIRLVLVIAGVLAFELTTGPFPLGSGLLLVYLVTVCVGVWVLRRPWRASDQAYLDYRTLAEYLRVRNALDTAGLPTGPLLQHIRYRGGELDWIRLAYEAWSLTEPPEAPGGAPGVASLRQLKASWIDSQADYYRRARAREASRHRLARVVTSASLLSAVILTVVAMLLLMFGPLDDADLPLGWTLFLAVGLLVVGAAVRGYAEHRAFFEHISRYRIMEERFERASELLEERLKASQVPAAVEIVTALATDALRENTEWLLLHRERPIEVQPG